jgi:cytochrome P450
MRFRARGGGDYPLYVIMSLLGLPEVDFPHMLKLTQEMFGRDDEELRRGATPEDQLAVFADFFAYFAAVAASRREQPTDDLASAIANARVDGEYLSDVDTASYYVIIATAGHDTTSAAISGGLLALIEHPQQRERLRTNMDMMPGAVEEMIRWSTPVKEFMRTATEHTTVSGVPIAAGESVYLAYASGNRDEDVFDEPFRFDIARNPTSIWLSATVSTSAWARDWPGWRSTAYSPS